MMGTTGSTAAKNWSEIQPGRVRKSGARFDESVWSWMNGAWIRALDTGTIYTRWLKISGGQCKTQAERPL